MRKAVIKKHSNKEKSTHREINDDRTESVKIAISFENDYIFGDGLPNIRLVPDENYLNERISEKIFELFEQISSSEDREKLISGLQARFAKSAEDSKPVSVPLWKKRTTGRDVSPADWIRMHYGRWIDDETWDPNGLKRSDLKDCDFPLYQAFAKWLERHPEDAFDGSIQKRPRYKTAQEALDARKKSEREASARYRERLLSNT